jgi:hypothetical protein
VPTVPAPSGHRCHPRPSPEPQPANQPTHPGAAHTSRKPAREDPHAVPSSERGQPLRWLRRFPTTDGGDGRSRPSRRRRDDSPW